MTAPRWTDVVYDVQYHVLRCPFERLEPWVLDHFGPGYDLTSPAPVGRTIVTPGAQAVVFWFPPDARVSPGTVAHEAVHAGCTVLRDRGVKLKPAAEEALAYYVEYLVREITRRVR